MNDSGNLLRHFLAALAYRTQKALRDAPADFGTRQGMKYALLQNWFDI
jgi:hypothetical protein